MIDHVLGRPSIKFRKVQVFAAVSFWSLYLYKGNRHGPPALRRLSALLSPRLTTWQTLVITLLWLYVSRNFGKVVGLECPEPLANLYTRSYFRATWVTTALDAGFWSAMKIKNERLRNLMSIVFSLYYLICAEQADEKVKKIRAVLTVEHLRVSWNKPISPYLDSLTRLMRPKLTRYQPRAIRIPRPSQSSYREPVMAWLYWDGSLAELKKQNSMVLDIPGGGFVAMTPRCHDDKLLAWAGKSRLPVLSLDYKKAPEHPYPYALNECYDVYHSIVQTRGRCAGLSGERVPRIIVSGDSAGGNLACGMTLMILQSGSTDTRRYLGEHPLPAPEGVVLIYPALDMNIGAWLTDEHMALIREKRERQTNETILRRKSDDYRRLDPMTPMASDDDDEPNALRNTMSPAESLLNPTHKDTMASLSAQANGNTLRQPTHHSMRTRLATSSLLSYFSDRIITPEMMRAMIILYIGPHHRPDFGADFLLSPILAPDALLARFPQTFMLTGERDPLVDDTVIFAGRIRQAKKAADEERRELGLEVRGPRGETIRRRRQRKHEDVDHDWVTVVLVPGISHGFLQFASIFPDGWRYIFRCGQWMREVIEDVETEVAETPAPLSGISSEASDITLNLDTANAQAAARGAGAKFPALSTASSVDGDDERPLEMSMNAGKAKKSPPNKSREPSALSATGNPSSTTLTMNVPALDVTGRNPAGTKSTPNGAVVPRAPPTSNTTGGTASQNAGTVGIAARRGINGLNQTSTVSGKGRVGVSTREREKERVGKGRRQRRGSLKALPSEEDLVGRRMTGLTTGLLARGDEIPPTP